MNSITHWVDRAISTWRNEEIPLLPGVSMTYIAEVEQVLGFAFPSDFKELYTKVNGFADNAINPHMFSLWPLDTIYKQYLQALDGQELILEELDEDFIAFCDFMVNSHTIGFDITKPGIYLSYDRREVAKSFSECIEMMNFEPALLY